MGSRWSSWWPLSRRHRAAAVLRCPTALLLCLALSGCGDRVEEDQLEALQVTPATLEPAFAPGIFEYTAEVAHSVTSVTVTPTSEDAAATVTVNGTAVASATASAPIGLAVGDNVISVVVTDDDGDRETYTVAVTRRPPPGSAAELMRLELTATALDQPFDSDLTEYTAAVGYLGASTRVVAEPQDAGAVLELDGRRFEAGEPSHYLELPVGTSTLTVTVTAEDGAETVAYQVEVSRAEAVTLQQQAYLKASNTGPLDGFGGALDLAGATLVVGAPGEGSAAGGVDGDQDDNALVEAGAAYVFERAVDSWMQSAYLKASRPGGSDRFGAAVAIDGDRIAVGAEGEQSLATGIDGNDGDNSGSRVGAAYVFARDGMGVWTQQAYLKAANADQGDEFGRALDFADGTLIVGAWSEDGSATGVDGDAASDSLPGAGAAYLFVRDDSSGWMQQAYLKASNTDGADEFGRAVAISGSTAAVGAPREDGGATGVDGDAADDSLASAGAVYTFARGADGDWLPGAYLKAANTDAGDRFGSSLALDGALLAVGAPEEDSAAAGVDGDAQDNTLEGAGAVYLFERDQDGEWSQIAYLKASNPGLNDGFGMGLALSGNVLAVAARGENSAAVGIHGDEFDDSAPDAGAVYVFERNARGDWQQLAYVKASNSAAGDEFGSDLGLYGDTLAVGAEFEDGGDTGIGGAGNDDAADAGAAYLIR